MKTSRLTDGQIIAVLKEAEEEDRRLKKMYADAQLSADLLREAIAKK